MLQVQSATATHHRQPTEVTRKDARHIEQVDLVKFNTASGDGRYTPLDADSPWSTNTRLSC